MNQLAFVKGYVEGLEKTSGIWTGINLENRLGDISETPGLTPREIKALVKATARAKVEEEPTAWGKNVLLPTGIGAGVGGGIGTLFKPRKNIRLNAAKGALIGAGAVGLATLLSKFKDMHDRKEAEKLLSLPDQEMLLRLGQQRAEGKRQQMRDVGYLRNRQLLSDLS